MKKRVSVVVILVVVFFGYRYYRNLNDSSILDIKFEMFKSDSTIQIAIDHSNYHFERKHRSGSGLIKLDCDYCFDVPFFIESKNLIFKDIRNHSLTVVVDIVEAAFVQNQHVENLHMKSGLFWNEKSDHANKYLTDNLPNIVRLIKTCEYTGSTPSKLAKLEKWEKDCIHVVLNNSTHFEKSDLREMASNGVKNCI